MNKLFKKITNLALAAAVSSCIFTLANTKSASALSELDILYKNAYDSMNNALTKKTQEAINQARTDIGKLPRSLKDSIGEFSKQVDTVQHPILVNIVNSIGTAQKDGSQVNINKARKSIPYNLPAIWRNSYSSAVDAVQQKLITKVDKAFQKASSSRTNQDLLDAKLAIAELKTVENNDSVLQYASNLETKINQVQAGDLVPEQGTLMTSPIGSGVVGKPVYVTYTPATTGNFEYKFSVLENKSWNVIANYGSSNKFTWFPLKATDFTLKVEGRTKGSSKAVEFFAQTNFKGIADPNIKPTPDPDPKPTPDPSMPNIIQPNYTWNSNFEYGNDPKYIILHHAEAKNASAMDVHRWHQEKGWAGIGYHFYIRKDGSIYRGRPENMVGAHCPGYNDMSIGICAEGSYMTETMPEAQKQAIIALGKYIKNKYNIKTIYGHGEVYSTDCPGPLYNLQAIKDAILK